MARVFAVYKQSDYESPIQLTQIAGTKPVVVAYIKEKLGEFKSEYLRKTKHGYVYERLGVASYYFTSEFTSK